MDSFIEIKADCFDNLWLKKMYFSVLLVIKLLKKLRKIHSSGNAVNQVKDFS